MLGPKMVVNDRDAMSGGMVGEARLPLFSEPFQQPGGRLGPVRCGFPTFVSLSVIERFDLFKPWFKIAHRYYFI